MNRNTELALQLLLRWQVLVAQNQDAAPFPKAKGVEHARAAFLEHMSHFGETDEPDELPAANPAPDQFPLGNLFLYPLRLSAGMLRHAKAFFADASTKNVLPSITVKVLHCTDTTAYVCSSMQKVQEVLDEWCTPGNAAQMGTERCALTLANHLLVELNAPRIAVVILGS